MTDVTRGPNGSSEALRRRLEQLSPAQRALLESKLSKARSGPVAEADCIPRRADGSDAPLTAGQELLWTLQRALPHVFAYNVPRLLDVRGRLDVDTLRSALDAIVARHEIFRTRFVVTAEGPRQVVAPPRPLSLEYLDLREALRGMPPETRAIALTRLIEDRIRIPFDLESDPQLRATVVRAGDEHWRLLLVSHHITSDETSRDILFRELELLYQAALVGSLEGALAALPPLTVRFGDFAAWQRLELERGALTDQIRYWRERLAGLGTMELPTDRARTSTPSFAGARHRLTLPDTVRAGVAALARSSGASQFMVLVAAVKAVLYRYTGQSDIAVGTPVSGRHRPDLDHVMGYFPSQVVLRTEVLPTLSFAELLSRVRETCLGAFEHQDVPIERLVAELSDRADSREPLFRVNVQMAGGPATPPRLGDATVQVVPTDVGAAKFDLAIGFDDGPAGLQVMVEYRTDLFCQATVARLIGHLEHLLLAASVAPGTPVSRLEMLTPAEQDQLTAWNDTAVGYPELAAGATLSSLILAQAAQMPDAIAVRVDDTTGTALTYGSLVARAAGLAQRLQQLGVGPDRRVAVSLERSADLVVALLGVLLAGGTYVPIDPEYPGERVRFMLEDAQPDVVLLHRATAAIIAPLAGGLDLLYVDEADAAEGATPMLPGPSADSPAYMIYTSGSTGRPKGALNAHRGIVNRLVWMQAQYRLTPADVVLQKTSFSFDVSVWEFFWPLLAGATLAVARPGGHRDPAYLADVIARLGVTTLHFVPSMLRAFTETVPAAQLGALGTLRHVMCSGEALPAPLAQRAYAAFPITTQIHNLYGPTECAVDVTHWTCRRGDQGATLPIGVPVANTRCHVLDAHGNEQPVGLTGELFIGGVQVGMGYHRRPELTAERFITHATLGLLYRTGDLARRLADGALEYLGRTDDQVKLRGYRIELGEVEQALARQPGVDQCAVILREDGGDRQLAAYLVATTPGDPPRDDQLRNPLRAILPDYMVPDALVFLDTLPLSSNGKVDRRALLALPAPTGGMIKQDASLSRAPRSALEHMLAEEWSTVLRRDDIGVDDDFFDLGGHSLLAMRLLGRIIERTGVRLPLRVVFERRTIAGMADAIKAAQVDAPPAAIPGLPADVEAPLSYGQELLWLMQLGTPELSAYNVPQLWRLHGPVDEGALERALQALLQRHQALRTIVVARGGHASQRLLDVPAPVLAVEDLTGAAPEQRAGLARQRVEALSGTPFELTREPGFRAVLLRLGAEERWLLQVTHHSVADGWSTGLMARELSALYTREVSGGAGAVLPPVRVQFREFAAWQRQARAGEWLVGELAWWRRELAGAPTSLELPTDRPRTSTLSFEGGRRLAMLPLPLLAGLKALAAGQGTTLFSVLLAAYAVLLHRYSGQPEVVIGTVVGNRPRADLEGTVGYFANTVPLRVSLADDPGFGTLIARVHDMFLRASEHTDVPFERLALELHDGSRASDPLVQAMFLLQNHAESPLTMVGVQVEPLEIGAAGAKVELTLSVTEGPDGLRTVAQHRRGLFDEATVDRMLGHFSVLLEAVAANPAGRVSSLPLLPDAERELLVSGWNSTAAPVPPVPLPVLIHRAAALAPSAPAVCAYNGALTYAALLDRSASIAAALVALGVQPGARVAVCAGRGRDLVPALLGVLRAGAAYVPIDPAYPLERIAYVLEDAAVSVVVVDSGAPALPGVQAPLLHLDRPIPAIADADFTDLRADPESLAYLLYTSGSTGRPKGVMVPHRALVNFLISMAQRPGLGAGDAIVAVTTVSFDISGLELWLPLITGAEVVLASRETALDGVALRALVESTAAARSAGRVLLQATPATWRLLIEAGWPGTPNLVMLCGGEAWPAGLSAQLLPRGAELWNVYGPTETTIWSTRERLTEPAVSLGAPLSNTTLYVLEPSGEVAPLGVPGELWIGGAGLAIGYYRRPDLTAERFVSHPELGRLYRTGDLVRRAPDGRLTYLGRLDDQVKIRGYRIELGEIESVLRGAPEVVQAVASVQRANDGAEPRLVGHVVLTAAGIAAEAVIFAALRDRLQRMLPDYMVPGAIIRLDALPLTPNGKVDRRALPVPGSDLAAPARPYVAPRSPLEEGIAAAWRDVLGVDRVGVEDDFFALGGHSLLAMRVLARLSDVVPVTLTLGALFEARTVAGLAALTVRRLAEEESAASEPRELEAMLARLDGLSDQEAARLLAGSGDPTGEVTS